ncbi:hypothetical protein DRQ36_05220 [bacterium]|nr:MAG: hypothetical protein DRQ36_05220 [bacterium]
MNMKRTFVILFTAVTAFCAFQWLVEVGVHSFSGTNYIFFGADSTATDGFDYGADVPFFIPPSGGYGYFVLSDTLHPEYTMLSTDLRVPGSDTLVWDFVVGGDFSSFIINWDISGLPDMGDYSIGAYDIDSLPNYVVKDWTDMRSVDSLEIPPPPLGGRIIAVGSPVSGIAETELPESVSIKAYPNPFNSSISIRVQGVKESSVQVGVFDINGRLIYEIPVVAESPDPGHGTRASMVWCPDELLPSGVYLIKLQGNPETTARVVLIR